MIEHVLKLVLCAIAATFVMGLLGLVRNVYRSLIGRRGMASSETRAEASDDPAPNIETPAEAMRRRLFDTVADQAIDLLYYDRKEDDELPRGAIEDLVATGAVTVDEIVAAFESALREGLPEKKA